MKNPPPRPLPLVLSIAMLTMVMLATLPATADTAKQGIDNSRPTLEEPAFPDGPAITSALTVEGRRGKARLQMVGFNLGDESPELEAWFESSDGRLHHTATVKRVRRTSQGVAGVDLLSAVVIPNAQLPGGQYNLVTQWWGDGGALNDISQTPIVITDGGHFVRDLTHPLSSLSPGMHRWMNASPPTLQYYLRQVAGSGIRLEPSPGSAIPYIQQ